MENLFDQKISLGIPIDNFVKKRYRNMCIVDIRGI